jgi:hypothetical protein
LLQPDGAWRWSVTRPHMRMLAFVALAATAALIAPRRGVTQETRAPDATIVVSSSTAASTVGLTLVEGTMRHRGKVYLLTLYGVRPAGASTGKVYHLEQARNVEGFYKSVAGELRNARGVTIIFDPPLDLQGGQLQIDLSSRVHPKASTGQRGTIE